ncbi:MULTISPECIES: 2-phosphosulfolactate phosphatase [unclassified Microbacterium]|uniref:2-phosphosulfolactate phosphatase n=1 Tax=unclassified Microbacterium TaxID=2609290 RepID=UPI00301706F9
MSSTARTPMSPDRPLQQEYEVRFDWAREGLRSIGQGAGVIVVIDAISFTTTVERAVSEGLEVQPFAGTRAEAEAVAAGGGFGAARLAGPRGGDGVTLSPSSLTAENVAAFGATRAVVPSFNGSRLSAAAAVFGVPVLAASLRNRTAVAQWILARQHAVGHRVKVAVVAGGEVRDDDTVRFSVEDLLTAGAVIDALGGLGIDACSPEAAAACAAYTGLARAARHLFTASTSGVELRDDYGQGGDVLIAAETDVSTTVPVLVDGVFREADPGDLADGR